MPKIIVRQDETFKVSMSNRSSYDDTELRGRIETIEGKEAGWNSKAAGTHTHTASDITNLPTVPTSDINANTAARHSHSNKSTLDGITEDKVTAWDGKANASHSHTMEDITDLPSIPQSTLELVNDAGFISEETDPTVPSWAKAAQKPTYTAAEVHALPDTTVIPAAVTDAHINSLIDAKLGVIENGSY